MTAATESDLREIEAKVEAYRQAVRDTERAYFNREVGRKYVAESEREELAALLAAIEKYGDARDAATWDAGYDAGLHEAQRDDE